MEFSVSLKICENCCCLWLQKKQQSSVYCHKCDEVLRHFPDPKSRKLRGRRSLRGLSIWGVAMGGAL